MRDRRKNYAQTSYRQMVTRVCPSLRQCQNDRDRSFVALLMMDHTTTTLRIACDPPHRVHARKKTRTMYEEDDKIAE